jgi:hypothetical protein
MRDAVSTDSGYQLNELDIGVQLFLASGYTEVQRSG